MNTEFLNAGHSDPTAAERAASLHLDQLTDEAITIIREVAAECENPVLLFSGGKDSAVLLHLALLAFAPARLPFPVMHVDTGHNFAEVIEYRDEFVKSAGVRLVIASVQASIDAGRVVEETGPRASRNRLQSVTLLDAINEHGFDAAFGGGRRDEDKARAKERILSFRDRQGRWDPRQQRPEPWGVLNARIKKGEHLRAFPISNWTEVDIWNYIALHEVALPSIYYSHTRTVVERDGMLLSVGGPVVLEPHETAFDAVVRYRTVGDASCTGAVESTAATVHDVIAEVAAARITERGATRADDTFSESAMEDRKREGYF
jgi:sulfate adenylyltransferase subunit 2